MRNYIEYKDSGIPWIGKTPAKWGLSKVKFLFSIGRGRVIATTEIDEKGLYPVYSSQTQNEGCLGYIETYDFDKEQITWTTDGANAGTIFLRKGKYNCTNVCGTLLPFGERSDLSYMKHLLEYIAIYHKRPDTNGYKIMNNEMANIIIPLPPVEEQQNIAAFLNNKTSAIDTLIANKEQLIELLKDKRQAIINEALTKGLDKNVEMKDSGVEWIGEIPKNWEVEKFKWIFEIVKRPYFEEDRPVLSITQSGIKIKNIKDNDGQQAETYSGYQQVDINDFAMNGMDLLTGYIDCSIYNGVTSPDYRVFRFLNNNIQIHGYYKYLFQTYYKRKIFYKFGQGVSNLGRWRLQTETLLEFPVPKPPIQTQIQIVKNIEVETNRVDTLVADITIQIGKLKEYRRSFISEVVTGKVAI